MNILFVCRANTGRSQIAEAFFNKFSSGKNHATSAGTLVNNKEHAKVSERPNLEPLLRALSEAGIDIADNLRKEVTLEMVDAADKIVVMAEPETIPDYLRNSRKSIYWDVADLEEVTYKGACELRDVIKEEVRAFIGRLERGVADL